MTQSDSPQFEDSIRVLHVDDDSTHLKLTKTFLEKADEALLVDSVASPEEALRLLESETFDCVVSDFQMPTLDGIELAQKIRETSNIPFMLYTGRGSEEVAEAAFTVGVDDYIRKEMNPSHYQVLARRIKAAVEKNRAELALEASEEKFRVLTEKSVTGIYILQDFKMAYVNPSFAELFGYSIDEIIGILSPQDLIYPDDRPYMRKRLTERLDGEIASGSSLYRAIRKDGSLLFVEAYAMLMEYQGKPAVMGTLVDVTERKRMEETLRESEKRYHTLAEVSPVGIFHTDAAGNCLYVNEQWCQIAGMTAEEAQGEGWTQGLHPNDRERVHKEWYLPAENGLPFQSEYRFSPSEGVTKWVLGQARAELDENGVIVGYVGTITDITDRKLLMEVMQKSEERLELIFEYAPDAIYLNDMKGNFIDGNRAAEKLTGYAREELIGKNFLKLNLLSRRQLPKAAKLLAQNLLGQPTGPDELTMTRKNGEQVLAEISTYPVKLRDGPVVMGIARDITERKRMEEELERIARERSSIQQIYEKRLELLHTHTYDLAKSDSLEEIADRTRAAIVETFDPQRFVLGMIEDGFLRVTSVHGFSPTDMPLDGPGIAVRAVRTGESQLVHNTRTDNDYFPGIPDNFEISLSELDVPIMIDESVVGVLSIESTLADAFNPQDQALVEILAKHVASSISRLRHVTELKEAERRTKGLLDESMEPIFVITGTEYAYVNRKGVELLGFDEPSELLGRDFLDFIAPSDREKVGRIALSRQKGEAQPSRYDIKLLKKDGTIVDCETHVSLIEYNGKPSSLAFARDITERKRMEEELRQYSDHLAEIVKEKALELSVSDERLRAFMASAPDAFTVYDSELNCLDVNQALLKYWPESTRKEDLIGKNMLDLDPGIKETGRYDRYLEVIKTGKPIQMDDITIGSGFSGVRLSLRAFKVGGGLGIITTDITDWRWMEEELVEAERMSAVGRVSAMVGHDLRGPLQTIKNSLYLMGKDPDSLEGLRETIGEAVDYAASMLEELRLNVGDSPLQLQEVNLGSLIRKAVDEASIPDSVEAELHVYEGLDSVSMDPLKMRRVLYNLVRNAVEAMPDGGNLKVSAKVDEEGMEITVRDSGTGIPDDLMQDLFKAFVTTKSKGMGLGLAYCKRAVEAHGGAIEVESEVDRGTTFTVRIPMKHE